MRLKITFNKFSMALLVIFCFIIAAAIGVIRYLTGPELALSLFFLFPIGLTTWYVGRWAGILISIASTISWLAADLMMLHSFSNVFIPYLNETFRLIVFLIITYIVFELKRAIDNQKELARTDYLTGIANRRAFFDIANLELNKARRFQTPISVVYMDIDNFKQINDYHGHHFGDQLLRSVAETIKKNIRAIDVIARFGGDEFGILLSQTGADSASLVARKLKRKLLELAQDNGCAVTFSFGVVSFESLPDSVDKMIKAADLQMHSAKKNGKNKIQYKVIVEDDNSIHSLEAA